MKASPNPIRKWIVANSKFSAARVLRLTLLSLLSMASIQAAAFGPPSPEERAKMDAALQAACSTDIQNLCSAATDHHQQIHCLFSNQANLSATCSAFVAQMKAHRPPHPPPEASNGSSSTTSSP